MKLLFLQTPMASDRDRTPYTEAVLHEVQRRGNITAIAFHSAARDCPLGGHHVPKGTQVRGRGIWY